MGQVDPLKDISQEGDISEMDLLSEPMNGRYLLSFSLSLFLPLNCEINKSNSGVFAKIVK